MTAGDQDRLSSVTTAGVSTDELTYDNEARVTQQKRTLLTRSDPAILSYAKHTRLEERPELKEGVPFRGALA